MNIRILSALAIAVLTSGSAAFADSVYNAAADFSATSNPNGVWTFGSESVLGDIFTPHTVNGTDAGLDYWLSGSGSGVLPGAYHNPTGSTIIYGGTLEMEPGQLILHPGIGGVYSVARFTVPTAGEYVFSANFIGQDLAGTTTDVHLLLNNVSIYNGNVVGFHNLASSGVFNMTLSAGDKLDAVVGRGSNNNYNSDSTGLDMNVSPVPLPPVAWTGIMCLAFAGGIMVVRRRPIGV